MNWLPVLLVKQVTGTVATTVNNTRIIGKTITFCSDQGEQRILFCGHFIFSCFAYIVGLVQYCVAPHAEELKLKFQTEADLQSDT